MKKLYFHPASPCALLSFIFLSFCSPAAATEAQPHISMDNAIHAFVDAVFLGCTSSKTQGLSVFELPSGVDDDLTPADDSDRAEKRGITRSRFFVSKALGRHLMVWEDDKGCHVVADQLPVQRTLDAAAQVLRESPGFVEHPFKPGYNPIGYEFARKVGTDLLTVHMEGAEPGLPLHAYRFSLIVVQVSRSSPRHGQP